MNTAIRRPVVQPVPVKPPTGIEAWERGIDKADEKWDIYDCLIKSTIHEYDMHLSRTPGYVSPDWRLIKAMLWTETGVGVDDWRRRPMQIGNLGDPAMAAVLANDQGAELVIPPSLRVHLSAVSITSDPAANIRAGIGYLLMRTAEYAYRSVPDSDSRVYEVTVGPFDTIDRIAKTQGSTPEVMKRLNPTAHTLRPGQVLKYQKASIRKVVTGWRSISVASAAARYNASRNAVQYASKLRHAMGVVTTRTDTACR